MTQIVPETIRLERLLDAPVETVWEYLVDAEKRGRWFAAGRMEQRAGGALELVFDHDTLSTDDVPYPAEYAPYKGAVGQETVTVFEPPHRLAFTFEGDGQGIAEFALTPEGGRTRLVLTHSGVASAAKAGTAGGWLSHLDVLTAICAGGAVRDFWALHRANEERAARGDY